MNNNLFYFTSAFQVYMFIFIIVITQLSGLLAQSVENPVDIQKNQESNAPKANTTDSKQDLRAIEKSWLEKINSDKTTIPNNNSVQIFPNNSNLDDNSEENINSQQSQSSSIFSLLIRLVIMLVVVLGGFYLLFRFLRQRTGLGLASRHELLTVIASINLPHPQPNGKLLQIIDMAGTLLLISISDSGIRLVSKITESASINKIRLWQSQNAVTQSGHSQSGDASIWDRIFGHLNSHKRPFWNFQNQIDKNQNLNAQDLQKSSTIFADLLADKEETLNSNPSTTQVVDKTYHTPVVNTKSKKTVDNGVAVPGRLNVLLMEQRRRLSKMNKEHKQQYVEQKDFDFDT